MTSMIVALIAFACTVIGIVFGWIARAKLPEHHLREESKEVVLASTGLIATLTAVALGLLISSAKSTFDAMNNGLTQTGAKVIALDRLLANYGPETREIRLTLRRNLLTSLQRRWPEQAIDLAALAVLPARPSASTQTAKWASTSASAPSRVVASASEPTSAPVSWVTALSEPAPALGRSGMDVVFEEIQQLSPQSESKRWVHLQCLETAGDLTMSRWQMIEEAQVPIPFPFLIVLVSWLTVLFACFSLMAPRNATLTVVLLLCALSASAAIFLLMEMAQPTQGVMKASAAPLVKALQILLRS